MEDSNLKERSATPLCLVPGCYMYISQKIGMGQYVVLESTAQAYDNTPITVVRGYFDHSSPFRYSVKLLFPDHVVQLH